MENIGDTLEIQIANAKKELPEISRIVIDAIDWKSILKDIGKKYLPEQQENLEIETELLLCGITDTESYPQEIEGRLKIPKNEVDSLILEIDNKIFKKIQAELEVKISGEEKKQEVKENTISTFGSKLSEAKKSADNSFWKESLYKIGTQFNLPIDEIGEIDIATDNFLLGKMSSTDYEKSVRAITGFSSEKTSEIIEEINKKIVKPKREALIKETTEVETKIQTKGGIPLPPYAKTNNSYKSPITSINASVFSKKEEPINSEKKEEHNLYKEHGIEILPNDTSIKEERVENPILKKEETPVLQPANNIIANKLFENTASKTVVNDYSLPKINTKIEPIPQMGGVVPEKPHDPYHEAI